MSTCKELSGTLFQRELRSFIDSCSYKLYTGCSFSFASDSNRIVCQVIAGSGYRRDLAYYLDASLK